MIVIEDNILFCDYICSLLQKADFKTMKAHGLAQAKKMIRGSIHEDDMVLADLRLPDGESTALLKWMRDNGYMHPFIMMTNYEEIHSAVHAMKLGAEDFILKPLVEDKLLPAIRKIKAANDTFSKVIYERRSASFCELNQYIHLVAPTDMTVLILGNTGTGKEHLANKIHRRSLRANKPYIKVDCGSLSKDLAASAFFGHVKGAFTGATEEKAGYFLEAQGGTLFMDEVENLSIETQRMLLRAMEERMCVSSRQPTRTCSRRWPRNVSAKTCCIVSMTLRLPYLRCKIVWKTYFPWRIFSGNSLVRNSGKRWWVLTDRQKKCCWGIAGREMSGS